MRNIWIIAKRDLASIFRNSLVAYFTLFIYYMSIGGFFYFSVKQEQLINLTSIFHYLSIILVFLLPIITIRTFSEERKNNTFELLYTSPIKNYEIYFGKFLSSYIFFLAMSIPTISYIVFYFLWSEPLIGAVVTSYIEYFLMGGTYICLALMFSVLIKNQYVSAIVTVITNVIFVFILGLVAYLLKQTFFYEFIKFLSFSSHFNTSLRGVLDLNNVFYFVVFQFFLMYTTINYLEVNK